MAKDAVRLENPKKDCFSYDNVAHACIHLESDDCEHCRFYKTWEQFEADADRARGLLRAKGAYELVFKYI